MPIEKVHGNTSFGAAGLAAPDMLPSIRTLSSPLLKGESSSSATQQQQKNQKPHLILEESSSSASKCSPKQPLSLQVLASASSRCASPTSSTALPTKIVMANGRILYRPIPIKPVRPLWLQKRLQQAQRTVVPDQVVQDFYETAESQGLSAAQVQEAAVQAAEWHRKWTMQDERNHTAPEQEATPEAQVQEAEKAATPALPQVVEDEEEEQPSIPKTIQTTTTTTTPPSALFDAALLMTSDLLEHARLLACNPSPEEEEDESLLMRLRLDALLAESSCDSTSAASSPTPSPLLHSEYQQQQQQYRPVYKRRFSETCHVIPDNEQVLIRPVAVRVMRPQALRPMDYYRMLHLTGPGGVEAAEQDDNALPPPKNVKIEEEQPTHSTIPKNVLNWRTTSRCSSGHLSPLTLSSMGTLEEAKSVKRNRTTSPSRVPTVPVLIEHEDEYDCQHEVHQVVCVPPPAKSVILISATEQMLRNKDRSLPTEIIHTNRHRTHHRLTACNSTSMSEAADSDDSSLSCRSNATDVMEARDGLLHALAIQGGAVPVKADGSSNSARFYECLEVLQEQFADLAADTRHGNDPFSPTVEGCWLTLTSPTYFGCLGLNDNSDPMYTLGRMAFDMFSPTSLVCSLQGNFNTVHAVSDANRAALLADSSVPKALREEVELGQTTLRTYNVVTAFTIEPNLAAYPNAPNKDVRRPIRGLMTTYGYTLPDPEVPNRHSVWITGGRIEPNNDPKDQAEWKAQFAAHPPKHGFAEQAKLLAVKLLMGAQIAKEMNPDDGSMEYTFSRPLGGHGLAFIDVLYVDESLRVVRGHRGTIFCFSRLPGDHSP